jgi:hypothetical protein
MFYSIFKSRTFWTLVAVFIVNGGQAIAPMLSPDVQIAVNGFLLMLATYLHVNPSQQYNTEQIG